MVMYFVLQMLLSRVTDSLSSFLKSILKHCRAWTRPCFMAKAERVKKLTPHRNVKMHNCLIFHSLQKNDS